MNREDWVTCEFEERCEGFTKNTMRNGLTHFIFSFALLSYNIRYKFIFEIIVSAIHNRTAISQPSCGLEFLSHQNLEHETIGVSNKKERVLH